MSVVTRILPDPGVGTLADRMDLLSSRATYFGIASAFVTEASVCEYVEPFLARGGTVELLTGTYGNFNRQAMFERLLGLAEEYERFEARVWEGDGGRRFHGKLYVWKTSPRQGEGWIGSANLTPDGLQSSGEVVLATSGPLDAEPLQQIRTAFHHVWSEGVVLHRRFVASYREAARLPPDAALRRPKAVVTRTGRRLLWVTSYRDYDEASKTDLRVQSLFPRLEMPWYRGPGSAVRSTRPKDLLCVVDRVAGTVHVAEVRQVSRDGAGTVLAYVDGVVSERSWNERTRRKLREAGISLRGDFPATRWLEPEDATVLIRTLKSLPSRA